MAKSSSHWREIASSQFPWEREALDFVRERFRGYGPSRAWTYFEFIAWDGSVNEVDLLAITPMGSFLVEIKSRPGLIRGDRQHWTWKSSEGQFRVADTPLLLANRRTKKLASALRAQKHPLFDDDAKLSAAVLKRLYVEIERTVQSWGGGP